MRKDQDDYLLSRNELAAALDGFRLKPNRLGIGAAMIAPPAARPPGDLLARLALSERARFEDILTVLVQPGKIARLHSTVAGESISRAFLAWPALAQFPTDAIAWLAFEADECRVGMRSGQDLRSGIARALVADESLRRENFAIELPCTALLVMLAVVEQIKLARLQAEMLHREPVYLVHIDEILARLAAAGKEDFRYPFLFLARLLPVQLSEVMNRQDVQSAIEALVLTSILMPCDESYKLPLFAPADRLGWILKEMLEDVSKVGFGSKLVRADGEIGHDGMLLFRSPFHIFLFDVAGRSGAFASLGQKHLDGVLQSALAPSGKPDPTPRKPEEAQRPAAQARLAEPKPEPRARFCEECGQRIEPGAKFCESCGAKTG